MISTCQRQTLTDLQTLLGLPAFPEVRGSVEAEVPRDTWGNSGAASKGWQEQLCALAVGRGQV